jgi:gliding motility-associated-like protein
MFVKVEDCCDFFIPSAFTPNGDGKNDFFKPVAAHVKVTDFKVYNRYGETVFQSSGTSMGWNGIHRGIPCDMGVYFWQVVYDCYGKSRLEKGDVTLVR